MTQEEAQAIYNAYNGRAGRKPATYNQAKQILGIEQVKKQNTRDNFIYKNDDVNENEKFRYVRIKQIQNLNSTNLTTDAYLLLLALQVSPNSNSLGAFKISLNEMQVQTAGLTKERITKALNELIMLGEVRYNDGIIFLNNFLSNQKQHGNKDNLIGIIKQYNSLADAHKLPYIASINYQQMNMEQVVNSFDKIKKGIECMGVIASGREVVISDYVDVYTQEQIENIIENNIESFAQTIPVVVNNKARLVVDEPQLDERSIEPVVETLQEEQVIETIQVEEEVQQPIEQEEITEPIEEQETTTQDVEEVQEEEKVEEIKIKMDYTNFDKKHGIGQLKEEIDETDYEVTNYNSIHKVTIRQVVAWFSKAMQQEYDIVMSNYKNDVEFKKMVNEIVSELTNRGNIYVTISFNIFCQKYNLPIPPKVVQPATTDEAIEEPQQETIKVEETNEDKLTKILNYFGFTNDNELQVDKIKAMLTAGSSEEVIKEAIQSSIDKEEVELQIIEAKQAELDKRIEKAYDPTTGKMSDELISRIKNK